MLRFKIYKTFNTPSHLKASSLQTLATQRAQSWFPNLRQR